MRRMWLAVLLCIAVGLGAPPSEAAPRTRAKKTIVKPRATAKKTAASAKKAKNQKKAAPAKKTAAKPKAAPGKKVAAKAPVKKGAPAGKSKVAVKVAAKKPAAPTPAARVTLFGAARGPSEARGRLDAVALTPDERTADAIDKILQGPLRWGTTGLYVVDAATGKELFAMHADDPLNPASNVKLVSTAAALDLLGPDFRYTTRLLGPTPDADGVVTGDVYLHGMYDPTLTIAGLDDLAKATAASGVRAIDGDIVVGGPSTRDGIYRARVSVSVAATKPGEPPRVSVSPASDFLEIVNEAKTGKRAKVKGRVTVSSQLVERDGKQRWQIKLAGPIGKGKSVTHTLSTKERHVYTAHLVRAALARAGVIVRGDVHTAELPAYVDAAGAAGSLPIVLGQHASSPLASIVAQVNKRSINWLSDRIIATAAALTADEQPSMSRGVEAMYAWLDRRVGVGRKEAVIDTGSGLSYRTELSPRQLVRIVRAATGLEASRAPAAAPDADAHWAACAEAFRHSLSVGGVDGTLRGRFRSDLRGRVVGKTGTLSNVIALSGLIEGAGGRSLAFSIVTNGHERRRKLAVRAAHEELLRVLDRYLVETAPDPTRPDTRMDGGAPPPAALPSPIDTPMDEAAAEALQPAFELAPAGDDLDDDAAPLDDPPPPPAAEPGPATQPGL